MRQRAIRGAIAKMLTVRAVRCVVCGCWCGCGCGRWDRAREAWEVIVKATGAGLPRRSALYAERAAARVTTRGGVRDGVYIYIVSVVCFD